jgi:hypothetical protein
MMNPVIGIELAGEIATDFPEVQVTLIHSGETLASPDLFTLKTRNMMLDTLKEKKVNVLLNERIVLAHTDAGSGRGSVLPGNAGYHIGSLTLKTESGKELVSGIILEDFFLIFGVFFLITFK